MTVVRAHKDLARFPICISQELNDLWVEFNVKSHVPGPFRGWVFRMLLDAYRAYRHDPGSFDRSKLVDKILERRSLTVKKGRRSYVELLRVRLRDGSEHEYCRRTVVCPRVVYLYARDVGAIDLYVGTFIALGWMADQFLSARSVTTLTDRYARDMDLIELAGIGGMVGHPKLYRVLGRDTPKPV